jgi:hypothetical protein
MLLDRIDTLIDMMRRSRTKSAQDAVLIRLEAEVERLHELLDEQSAGDGQQGSWVGAVAQAGRDGFPDR